MMDDRKLLEFAAKAAGYQYAPHGGYIVVDGIPGNWNPLENDGDALRLAVSLEIDIVISTSRPPRVAAWCSAKNDYLEQQHSGDAFSATRRAIVRAAAEIWKSAGESWPE